MLIERHKPLLLTRRFRSIAYPASYEGTSNYEVWSDRLKGRGDGGVPGKVYRGDPRMLQNMGMDVLNSLAQQQAMLNNAYGQQQAALANQQNAFGGYLGNAFGGAFFGERRP